MKFLATLVVLGLATAAIYVRFLNDRARAAARAAQGSTILATRCGPIEYQEAGLGAPLLMIHGSGGGHDQGMAFARPLARHGLRVIAMSRFGYLRTPRPLDASPEAQADAHVCLLDALGIDKAVVVGGSAGAPSALQMAIRHPDRVGALALIVPIAYQPSSTAHPAPPISDRTDAMFMRLLGSDFRFWAALQVARDQVVRYVLATPPALLAAASDRERERVKALVDGILPVSARIAGLRDDTGLGKRLTPYPLESIRAPTLVVSARDDGFGTYAAAEYTASRIADAKIIGFETGGHLWVGHDDAVRREIVDLARRAHVQPGADTTARVGIDEAALPAPVARYLRLALGDNLPRPESVEIHQTGQLRTDGVSGRWMDFTAVHVASAAPCAFTWNARVRLLPLIHLRVIDSLRDGLGAGRVLLQSRFEVAMDGGTPQMNSGALHRYLAEAVWYPWALVPGKALRWTAIDDDRALATLTCGGTTVSLEFTFGEDGTVVGIYTPARWGKFGAGFKQLPWEGHFSDYTHKGGVIVPSSGEVGWHRDGQLRIVWRGRITRYAIEASLTPE
ncbi:MAG: DUF6544 family protein [Steroidobacteraceae bacterium]